MKKFLLCILAAAMFFFPTQTTFAKEVTVPEDIYKWIDSTPRGNYFFNVQQTNYAVKEDGTIDLTTIIAPTICTYDNIQIDDVVQKRRWRGLKTDGYGDLIGRADYLKFDLEVGTVQVVERVDLDSTFSPLSSDKNGRPIPLSRFSQNEIARKVYRAILVWARDNTELMVKRSRGKLNSSDAKLKIENYPIKKFSWIDENK